MMKRFTMMALMVMLAGSMLAGCGKSKPAAAAAQGQPANGGGTTQARQAADVIGKVVSVKDGKLTINKSTVDPSAMQGGRRGGGQGKGRNNSSGNAQQGNQPPSNGAQGKAPQGGRSSTGGAQGNSQRGGFGRAMEFSKDTVSYTVTDQTKVTTRSFSNKKMQTQEKSVSELKAGDIIMIWLTDDKSGIASIQMMPSGGFGGGRGAGRGGAAGGGSGTAGQTQSIAG